MSAKIHWKTTEGRGSFPLRGEGLTLLWDRGRFDRVDRDLGAEEAGLRVELAASPGRMVLAAQGGLRLQGSGGQYRKVVLPDGRGISFVVEETRGELGVECPPSEAQDPLIGTEMGGYQLLGRLGSGAVGVVYRALQTRLDREVALKMLNDAAAHDPQAVALFEREARAAGRLSHPNLVQVHDVGEEGGHPFYSMELVPGGNLETHLREHGPLPWQQALSAVRDCAQALDFARQHGLVHRDVKPENLMRSPSGHVKLADLGLAATRGMLDREAAGGTPHFMAPEAARGGRVDHRSDLYSLGCTLYRLLTGETPFQGSTVREILQAHVQQDPPSPRRAGVELPRGVEELLFRLMAKDPADRPETGAEVAAECERLLLEEASARPRRFPLLLLLFLLAGGGFGLWKALAPPPETTPLAPSTHDGQAAELEAKLAAARERTALLEAEALSDPDSRIAALQRFLDDHPESDFAARARADLEAARSDQTRAPTSETGSPAELGSEPSPPPPSSDPAAPWRKRFAAALREGRPGVLLGQLADTSELDEITRGKLLSLFLPRVETLLSGLEEEHAQALARRDEDRAAGIQREFSQAVSGAPQAEASGWRERSEALARALADFRRQRREEVFREARRRLLGFLRGRMDPALGRLDFASAAQTLDRAAGECPHSALRAAAAAGVPLPRAAERGMRALRQRLESGAEIPFTEPLTHKRALLRGWEAEGPVVEVQIRGERQQRSDSWEAYRTVEVLPTFLEQCMGSTVPPEDRQAILALEALRSVAATLRSWGERDPDPAAAEALASEIRAWRDAIGEEDLLPALAPERAALALAEDAARALAADSPYLAWERLGQLQEHYSLLAALCSDGSSDWGLRP